MTDVIMTRIEAINNGELPEGYKRTKAGIMPEDWDGAIRAKQLFKSHTDKKHNGDLEILASTQERGIVPRSQIGIDIQCSDEGVKGYKKVSKGDFVISLRSFQGGIEYSEYDGIISPAYTVLKPINDISTGFYRNYFKTDSFIDRLNGAVYGIRDGKQIGHEDFADMHVHYPPLAEQERIAEILMQCDKVIELTLDRIEAEKKKKSWLYQQVLTGKTRLKGYTAPWAGTTVGEQVEYLVGYPFESANFLNNGVKLLRGSNVKRGKLSWETDVTAYWNEDSNISDYLLQEGDIVIAMDGAQVGRSFSRIGNNDLPCYLVQRVARLRSNINGLIVQWIGGSRFARHIDQRKTSTAIPHMTIKDILSYPISIPTDKKEIEQISQLLNQQDQLIDLLEKELDELRNRKASLAQLLLTGIVRTKV